ncbi:MAG: NADH-quinone oxidoreductase subunit A [Candidatus Deianiraeaceae bacterium]|jgi:NADH-quinone oxidoreductase subunit A
MEQYLIVLLYLLISAGIAIAIVLAPFIIQKFLGTQDYTGEKLSPYECGFEPVGTAPRNFNVKFYLVAILFVIFDLEIALLFPWALNIRDLGIAGYTSAMFFLFIVTFGFIYEWNNGALEW